MERQAFRISGFLMVAVQLAFIALVVFVVPSGAAATTAAKWVDLGLVLLFGWSS